MSPGKHLWWLGLLLKLCHWAVYTEVWWLSVGYVALKPRHSINVNNRLHAKKAEFVQKAIVLDLNKSFLVVHADGCNSFASVKGSWPFIHKIQKRVGSRYALQESELPGGHHLFSSTSRREFWVTSKSLSSARSKEMEVSTPTKATCRWQY